MGRWIRIARLWVRSLVRSQAVDRELEEELRFHLDRQIADDLERGLPQAAAERRARLALGGLEQQKEACRDARGVAGIDHVVGDLRQALRSMRRSPGFATVVVLSLAVGIGGNTAVVELIDAVRLRALPVARPNQLVDIRIAGGNGGWGVSENENSQLTFPLWEQIAINQQALSGLFAWGTTSLLVGSGPDAHQVTGLWLTGSTFPVLGVPPLVGRLFVPADDRPGCTPAAVLNDEFWRAEFGADPSVVGRTMLVLDRPIPVIGVTQRGFFGLEVGRRFDVALPACAAALWGTPMNRRDYFWLSVMGRLRPDWTVRRAAQHFAAISPALLEATLPPAREASSLERYRRFRLTAESAANGVSALRSIYTDALWALFAMTALVWLMVCTNLTTLLLARATNREQEIAVRLALGASRRRLIAQLAIEHLLLASIGSVLGVALAHAVSQGLVHLLTTDSNPWFLNVRTDGLVLTCAIVTGMFTCVVFGSVPALRAVGVDPNIAIKSGGRALSADRRALAVRRGLVTAQVAISLVLMFGAVLFGRSLRHLLTVDTGFRPDHVTFARFADFSEQPFPDAVLSTTSNLLDRIRSVPGVQSAAITTQFPLNGSSWTQGILFPGAAGLERASAKFTYVSPQYFDTMGMRILRGRDFTIDDSRAAPKVAIVNQTFARRYLHDPRAMGSTIRTVPEPGFPEAVYEVIGIASDTKYAALREPVLPIVFVPVAQHPNLRPWPGIAIRSAAEPRTILRAVKDAIAVARPHMTVGFTIFETQIRDSLVRERVLAWVTGSFGAIAAALAAIGVYGVVAYIVRRRRHEIAIRVAVGASRDDIMRLVGGELLLVLTVGLLVGVAASAAVGTAVTRLLFEVSAHDPVAFTFSLGVMAAIGLLACWGPAWSASNADATQALRSE